jgi:uncharacterized repeat protein (TIGR01451 family)
MNKNSRKMLPTVLATILLVMVFAAMCAPVSATGIELHKNTIPPTAGLEYGVGETVPYNMTVDNPANEAACTLIVTDVFPNGTTVTIDPALTLNPGQGMVYYTTYVVEVADVTRGYIMNTVRVVGDDVNNEHIDASMTKTNDIYRECEFDFEFEQACCKKIKFFNPSDSTQSGSSVGEVTEHTWDFGDGNTEGPLSGAPENYSSFIYIYDTCGWKWVTLSGSCDGVENETRKHVYVDCGPTARATASPRNLDCDTPTTVTFDGRSSTGDTNSIVSYDWAFSDGTFDSGDVVNKTVTLAEGVILTATLTVNDSHCEDSDDVGVKCSGGCSIRLYGTYGEGAGNLSAIDPETGLAPENKPYSNPEGPFFPQHNESPNKDFMTFMQRYRHTAGEREGLQANVV